MKLTEYLNDSLSITGYSQVLRQTDYDAEGNVVQTITNIIGHQRISQKTVKNGVEQELYFGFDGHGSTRVLLDVAGAIAQLFAYDAYGQAIGFNPADALTEFLYSGEQFDAKIGQQYLRQRYYDPSTGRFNRLDPFFGNLNDPQSLHKYLYTHADPVNGVDPSGLTFFSISIGGLISSGMRGLNQASLGAYMTVYNWSLAAPVTFRLLQYGSASLSIIGTLNSPDPAMDFIMGPAGAIDDLVSLGRGLKGISQMLAKNTAYASYKGLSLFKQQDSLRRAQGIVARILPENVNTSLGSSVSIDPTGWSDMVANTTATQRARGHFLARWFGGPGNDPANLVPLYRTANDKMRILVETPIANALRGIMPKYKEAVLQVTPHYNGYNLIPDYLTIKAIGIDGSDVDHVIFDGIIYNTP